MLEYKTLALIKLMGMVPVGSSERNVGHSSFSGVLFFTYECKLRTLKIGWNVNIN